eukprot:scaffold2237_cov175-Ochromonas_danica.AAC.30
MMKLRRTQSFALTNEQLRHLVSLDKTKTNTNRAFTFDEFDMNNNDHQAHHKTGSQLYTKAEYDHYHHEVEEKLKAKGTGATGTGVGVGSISVPNGPLDSSIYHEKNNMTMTSHLSNRIKSPDSEELQKSIRSQHGIVHLIDNKDSNNSSNSNNVIRRVRNRKEVKEDGHIEHHIHMVQHENGNNNSGSGTIDDTNNSGNSAAAAAAHKVTMVDVIDNDGYILNNAQLFSLNRPLSGKHLYPDLPSTDNIHGSMKSIVKSLELKKDHDDKGLVSKMERMKTDLEIEVDGFLPITSHHQQQHKQQQQQQQQHRIGQKNDPRNPRNHHHNGPLRVHLEQVTTADASKLRRQNSARTRVLDRALKEGNMNQLEHDSYMRTLTGGNAYGNSGGSGSGGGGGMTTTLQSRGCFLTRKSEEKLIELLDANPIAKQTISSMRNSFDYDHNNTTTTNNNNNNKDNSNSSSSGNGLLNSAMKKTFPVLVTENTNNPSLSLSSNTKTMMNMNMNKPTTTTSKQNTKTISFAADSTNTNTNTTNATTTTTGRIGLTSSTRSSNTYNSNNNNDQRRASISKIEDMNEEKEEDEQEDTDHVKVKDSTITIK